MRNNRLVVQVEGAIMAAVAMALEYIPTSIGPSSIQVSLGIIPIALYSFRRGTLPGMVAALIWGVLDLFLRGFSSGGVLTVWQGLLEYTIAFAVVGLAGLVQGPLQARLKEKNNWQASMLAILGIGIGAFTKYLFHFIAGVVYWGSYAQPGVNIWLYSLIINGGSFVASLLVAGVVISILLSVNKQLFLPKR